MKLQRNKKLEDNDNTNELSVRLTGRDKELLAHVAAARYLTLQQLRGLVFTSRSVSRAAEQKNKQGPSERICKRRLARLFGGATPYLRRLKCGDEVGAALNVYATTPLGHAVARQVLRRAPPLPTQDLKGHSIEHTVAFNNLYVALAEGCTQQRIPPHRYPFWWVSTEIAGLPWRERNERTGQVEDRRLVPDSVLELTGECVRVFVESEIGSHLLVRRDENTQGSVLSKLHRYGAFMLEGGQQTFYSQKYSDGWKAELVFLVNSEQRAANVAALAESWRAQNKAVPLTVRAFSLAQAAAHFCRRLRLPAPPMPAIEVQPTDLRLACSFVSEVTATYKAVRHYLRANPGVRAQGVHIQNTHPSSSGWSTWPSACAANSGVAIERADHAPERD